MSLLSTVSNKVHDRRGHTAIHICERMKTKNGGREKGRRGTHVIDKIY
jgi:hypothetical protein